MLKNIIKISISVILPSAILFFLFKKIGFSELNLKNISWQLLLTPLVFFFFIKLINTIRYSRVYSINPSFKLYSVLCHSNLMLSLIPLRLGEFSYLHSFKKYFNIPYTESTKKLILIRFTDYVVVYLLLLLSSIYVSAIIKQSYVSLISLFFVISLIIGIGIIYLLNNKEYNFKNKTLSKVFYIFKQGVKSLSYFPKKEILFLIIITLAYWLLRLFMGYVVLKLLGINISFIYVVFISLLFLLIGLLPVQTFANFGIFEGGWTYFLVILGYSYSEVLPSMLKYHFILLLPSLFYGTIFYIILKIKDFKKHKFYSHLNHIKT